MVYASRRANAVAPAPLGIDLFAAATIPLPGLTASQGLELLAPVPGSTVLVAGAAGAVGGYVVELAKAQGHRVIGLDVVGTEDIVRGVLGADDVIVAGDRAVVDVRVIAPDGVDGVFDAASLGERVVGAVKDGGSYVTTDPRPESLPAPQRGVRTRVVLSAGDGARLSTLSDLVAAGTLALRIAETFALGEVRRAHECLAKGGLPGKVIVIPLSRCYSMLPGWLVVAQAVEEQVKSWRAR